LKLKKAQDFVFCAFFVALMGKQAQKGLFCAFSVASLSDAGM